jgi:DNA-binding response OmpR family regulator
MNLLLVEDSLRLGPLLVEALHGAGYSVDLTTTAKDCLDATKTTNYDLFIIDLGLPDQDGGRLISHLRSKRIQQPILIITARAGVEERVFGLDLGADDYLVKPFNTVELLARVRALLRRPTVMLSPTKQAGRLMLDLQSNVITLDTKRVDLTPSEHRLLALFIRRGERIVTATDIEQISREFGRDLSDNGVQQAISRLRKQIAQLDPNLGIQTIRGSGYALSKATPD